MSWLLDGTATSSPLTLPATTEAQADLAPSQGWLVRFLQHTMVLNAATTAVSLLVTPMVGHALVPFIVGTFLATHLFFLVALYWAQHNRPLRAAVTYYVACIVISTVGVAMVPAALPATIVASLLGVMGVLPYLAERQMRWMIPISLLAVPVHFIASKISPWYLPTIDASPSTVTFFTAYCVGLGLLLLRHYHRRMIEVQGSLEALVEERTRELKDRESRFRAISQMTSDHIFVLDLASPRSVVEQFAPTLTRVTGYPAEVFTAFKRWVRLVHPDDWPQLRQYLRQLFIEPQQTGEFRVTRPDGTLQWLRFYSSTEFDSQTRKACQIVGAIQDLTESRRTEDQIRQLAFFDPLTGLANRRYFNDRLAKTLRSLPPKTAHSVLFMDLDRFKMVNDTLGHEIGDQLLIEVGQRLAETIRAEDLLARFGGDEFAVLCRNTIPINAQRLAQRIVTAFDRPFTVKGNLLRTSVSVGVACAPLHGMTVTEIMRHADIAMYQAKRRPLLVQMYDPTLIPYSQERLLLEEELRQAILQDGLCLYYQPLLNVRQNVMPEVEALVRWNHHERGFLPPSDFIPLAEESGLIRSLDRWVIRTALDFVNEMEIAGTPLTVSINLSMPSLETPDLLDFVVDELIRSHAKPARLKIEVTESMLMDDVELALENLRQFKAMGMKIALDDFGSGHASLNRLKQLPVDTLKVDRYFIKELFEDPKGEGMIMAIIALAHSLDLQTTAEGVEEYDQLEWLRAAGIDYAQGYHIARPMPPEQLKRFLDAA